MGPTKQNLEGKLGYFKLITGVTRRLVDQFPSDKIHYRPTDTVRSAAEIVSHVYTFMEIGMRAVVDGKMPELSEPVFTNKAEMLAYMDGQVDKLFELWARVTDAQLAAAIPAWGSEMKGFEFVGFIFDEHWHHRGQLTIYLRLLGIQPVMIYDYEGN